MASIDLIRASNGSGDAVKATVTNARVISSTTIQVDATTNWPSKFIATVGDVDGTGAFVPATVTVFNGTLSGGNIEITSFAPGYTDIGNTPGQIVVLKPTTAWANEVADVLAVTHNQNGTLKANSVTTAAIADNAVTADKIDWATDTDWSASAVATGWSSTTVKEFYYQRIGNIVFFFARVEGTSNSTTTTLSLPIPAAITNTSTALVLNSGTWSAGTAVISASTVSFLTAALANLSATGTKGFRINGFYFV